LARTFSTVDSVEILAEETPANTRELARLMRRAWEDGIPMIPVGGGTKLHIGNTPPSAPMVIRTTGLRGVVEYEPDNMTVSALAGTTLGELQEILQRARQFLPLDPPLPEQATLGGLVAANASGPIRFRYGTLRDFLIGIKILFPDGTETKAGGKLVKNVTGYDMCKLYTGSFGTLGILTELTFKVQPIPESHATALLAFPSFQSAHAATLDVMHADLLPEAMEIWNRRALEGALQQAFDDAWYLLIRLGEVSPAVIWQLQRLQGIVPGTQGSLKGTVDTLQTVRVWRAIASAREGGSPGETALVKCSTLREGSPQIAAQLESMARTLEAELSLYCHAGNDILYGRMDWEDKPPDAEVLRGELLGLRMLCHSTGGHMVVERVASAVKQGLDVWGYDAPALDLMRRIKREFDPKGLLNPGRFVGGI
jgi:glycolate oxidase FAD binding subunit